MFDIDLQSRTPIYEQLYKRVVELTVKKQLRPGDKLPSVRELAKALGVNPNTVSKAFQNLERDGVIYSLAGRGSFISDKNSEIIKQTAAEKFTLAAKEAAAAGLTAEELTEIIRKIAQTGGNKID
ncbi:MAG: GntR family transcriptional regulator [Huintestinicola sp.]